MDLAERTELFKKNKGLAHHIAYKYTNVAASVEADDILQEALLALWLATDRFDAERSGNFGQFAYYIIMSKISAYLFMNKHTISIPHWMSQIQYWQAKMADVLVGSGILLDTDYTLEEIVATDGVHPAELLLTENDQKLVSKYKKGIRYRANGFSTYERLIEDSKFGFSSVGLEDIVLPAIKDDIAGIDIMKAISMLDYPEREAIKLRLEGYSLDEIAEKMGLSKPRIWQRIQKAKKLLIMRHGDEDFDYEQLSKKD